MKRKRLARALAVLAGLLMLLGFVGGLGVWHRARRDPERLMLLAESLLGAGDIVAAKDQFNRAWRLAEGPEQSARLLLRMADRFEELPPLPVREALDLHRTVLAFRRRAARLDQEDVALAGRLLDSVHEYAAGVDTVEEWRKARELARETAGVSDEHRHRALKLQAVADFRLAERGTTRDDRWKGVARDLQAARAHLPHDPELSFLLARCHVARAAALRRSGLDRECRDLVKQARDLVEAAAAGEDVGQVARINEARLLLEMRAVLGHDEAIDEATALLLHLGRALLGTDQGEGLVAVGELLRRVHVAESRPATGLPADGGGVSAAQLAAQCLASRPGDAAALLLLGRVQRDRGDLQEAERLFCQIRSKRSARVGADAPVLWAQRAEAGYELGVLHLLRAEQAGQGEERERWLREAVGVLQRLRHELAYVGASGLAEQLSGRISYLRGDARGAVRSLYRADRRLRRIDPTAVFIGGMALAELGETGAAIEWLGRFVVASGASRGRVEQALAVLARSQLRLHSYDEARGVSDRLLALEPASPQAALLKAQALAGSVLRAPAEHEEDDMARTTADLLRSLAAGGHSEALRQLADFLARSGDVEEAIALLDQHCGDHPEDRRALTRLAQIESSAGRSEQAEARLKQAAAAAPDNDVRAVLAAVVAASEGLLPIPLAGRLLELAWEPDAFDRSLGLYQVFVSVGAVREASRAFVRAATLRPADRDVMRIGFRRALAGRAWEEAEGILRLALGEFLTPPAADLWRARLLMARGDQDGALGVLLPLVDEWPLCSEVPFALAECRRLCGDASRAEEELARALLVKPDHVPALEALFRIRDSRGDHGEALASLRRAVEFAPNDDRLIRLLLDYLGKHVGEAHSLGVRLHVARLRPWDQANRRAAVRMLLAREQPADAKAVLDELLADYPDSRDNVMLSARYQERVGRPEAGTRILEEYLASRGDMVTFSDLMACASYFDGVGSEDDLLRTVQRAVALEDPRQMPASLRLADLHMRQGRFAEALGLYQNVCRGTGSRRALRGSAEALLRLGRPRDAAQLLADLRGAGLPPGELALLEARVAAMGGNAAAAARACDRAVKAAPDTPSVYAARARLHARTRDASRDRQVREDLEKALQLDAGLSDVREMLVTWFLGHGLIQEALMHAAELARRKPDIHSRGLFGRLLLQEGELVRLRGRLAEWRRDTPSAAVWDELEAGLLLAEGRHAEALPFLQRRYEQQPGPGVLSAYASGLLAAGRAQDALILLEAQGDGLALLQPPLLLLLAQARAGVGRDADARETFGEAVDAADSIETLASVIGSGRGIVGDEGLVSTLRERRGRDPTGLIRLTLVRLQAEAGEAEEAIRSLTQLRRQLSEESPLQGRLLVLLGALHQRAGRSAAAARAYEEALILRPEDPVLLNNMAFLLTESGKDLFRAIRLAEDAVRLTGEHSRLRVDSLDTLGYAQLEARLPRQAEATLTRSVRLYETANARYHLGQAFQALGRANEAKRELMRARELSQEGNDAELTGLIEAELGGLEARQAARPGKEEE